MLSTLCLLIALAQLAVAGAARATAPAVKLDNATVVGFTENSVTSYLGIPFAQPPVGDLRLRLPGAISPYNGTLDGTKPSAQCMQLQAAIRPDLPPEMRQDVDNYFSIVNGASAPVPTESEDCLTINVHVPEGAKAGDKLPVIAFRFAFGSNTQFFGDVVIRRSIELNTKVIFVAMNYRLHAFGFLGGKEVKEAGVGNLGLHDQREALRWVRRYIDAFGGDPEKVTLWGPSAGAISSALHMLANRGDTEGLFRAAVMNAGSSIPTGDITQLQPSYDKIVQHAGCADASDTLDCLRGVPASTLVAAAATIPSVFDYPGLANPWLPRADGVFLTHPPQQLVLAGRVAKVPILTGDALDEGTIFATGSYNITTEDEFRDYLQEFFFPRISKSLLSLVLQAYPDDQLAPMYKRMAAFQGDWLFQAPRRLFLDELSSRQPTWSFISRRGSVPGLGAAHGTDVIPALAVGNELTDYIIQFAATLDPNGASNKTIPWPKYDTTSRQVLSILEDRIEIGHEAERTALGVLSTLSFSYPI